MPCHSKLIDVLPPDYGYVVFTAVGSLFLDMWLAFNVMKAREEHNVKGRAEVAGFPFKFDRLEHYPTFLMLLFVGGLQYPRVAAGGGVVFLLGRIAYALGYYSGDPEKRTRGSFGYIGMIALIGSTLSFGAHQLKLIK